MSNFRKYFSFLIDIGTTLSDVQLDIKARFVEAGWQVVNEVDGGTDSTRYIDYRPPVGQTIGNATGYELLRVEVKTTEIAFNPYVIATGINGYKRYNIIATTATSGLSPSVNVGGTVVTGTNTAGQPMDNGILALYNALVASSDPAVSKWNYQLVSSPGTSDDVIVATSKTANNTDNITTGSYTSVSTQSDGYIPGNIATRSLGLARQTVTLDISNGTIYFLSFFDRTVILATKTINNYFGPIFASYGDNASAVAQTPAGCVPIECITGNLNVVTLGSTFTALGFTHAWGYYADSYNVTGMGNLYTAEARAYSAKPEDVYYSGSLKPAMYGYAAGMTLGYSQLLTTTGNTFEIAGLSVITTPSNQSTRIAFGPSLGLEDVTFFLGTATDESLRFVRDVDNATTLNGAITNADNTLTLTSAANFPTSGTIVVENEVMTYTGKSGNTLTGVVRAKYGTAAASHQSAVNVYPAIWYVKIKGGAMMCGYTKPS